MRTPQEEGFRSLTTKQRAVWKLYMREGLSEYETARLLGISRDAVHDRLNKARRRFTLALDGVAQ